MKQKHITKGFTLIEVLLSLTIFSILISGSSFLLLESLQIRASVESVAEIDFQGTQILHVITEQIRNADSISSPLPGTNSSSLTLSNNLQNSIFTLFGTSLIMAEGFGPFAALNSSRVAVENITFENRSRPGTPGTIRISLTLSHYNPENRTEFDVTKTFVTSASIRTP